MEILSDKNKKGKERPWIEKKIKSIMLADSYKRLGFKKLIPFKNVEHI